MILILASIAHACSETPASAAATVGVGPPTGPAAGLRSRLEMISETDRASSLDLGAGDDYVIHVESPLHTDSEPAGKELGAEDTNAVVCPSHKDFPVTRIFAAYAAPKPVQVAIATAMLCFTVALATYHEGAVTELQLVADGCFGFAVPFGIIPCAWSMRRVTAAGGELALLGAGEAMISSRARGKLRAANVLLMVPTVLGLLAGLICFVSSTQVGSRSKLTGRLITAKYASVVFVSGIGFIHWAAVFSWWLTLKIASVLVSDAVAEARQLIERCDPRGDEWGAKVVPAILGLCENSTVWLSRGWGFALGCLFCGCWVGGVGFLAVFLEHGAPSSLAISMLWFATPLVVAHDAAGASSECDLLADTLNGKRMRGPKSDLQHEHAISQLEKILDRQNTKQGVPPYGSHLLCTAILSTKVGSDDRLCVCVRTNFPPGLGFVVFGRVVDMKTLGNLVGAIISANLVILPVIFSLRSGVQLEESSSL
eukprot:SAG22_NODE_2787_length_2210_cov_4.155850_1_plen_483_part_00